MRISAATGLLGVLGHPVNHSLSPAMQNAALRALGLDYVYLAFDVAPPDLKTAVSGLAVLGATGFNVTVPHKEAILDHLDRVEGMAAIAGAVNTVVSDGGRFVGYNTDGPGLLLSLAEVGFEVKDCYGVILGAGGAARSAAYALAHRGARRIVILNRTPERAERLRDELCARYPLEVTAGRLTEDILGQYSPAADLLVNATSLGLGRHGGVSPVRDPRNLPRSGLVCDLVYGEQPTPLEAMARDRRLPTVGGLSVLLYQGVEAFRLFFDREPPVEAMKKALRLDPGAKGKGDSW